MRDLIELLSDGHARTEKLLAIELHTTVEDVRRQIEYLEHMGIIHKVDVSCCSNGCGGDCGKCAPKDGFKNMGAMYEIVLKKAIS
ncbi:FeoC-like transcriptional regulator [Butyrivibrio sp. YAB3001]|uniref:FeoC-like transcriptional regulator n=1 Tax=Butyrivibrio sp. YAB3001 TaxID=1520812 RepID=UPI0008F66BE8|nr:FeoC-like transcriptional regulator [Butyrivibrio sp. YAB3001]SFC54019.1 FeoC like transcriptional regulator [Butyrivibrio sp. YAB3001]